MKYYIIIGILVLVSLLGVGVFWQSTEKNDYGSQEESEVVVGGWFFPGFCELEETMEDFPRIDIIKPQWAYLGEDGGIRFYNDDQKCDGFSPENVQIIKSKSDKQYLNVVSLSSVGPMRELLDDSGRIDDFIKASSEFLLREDVDFVGIEIDFERSLEWTEDDFNNYISFLKQLKTEYDQLGLEIIVDMPAIDNQENLQENHPYKYSELAKLDLDGYVLMIYDYMYAKEDPVGIAPSNWATRVVEFAKAEFGSQSHKLIGGIHSYGYKTKVGEKVRDLEYFRYVDVVENPLYTQAKRDESGETNFVDDGERYYFADSDYLEQRKDLFVDELGLKQVNVWQILGNPWFE